jgi:epoxyqueuosine reductase
VDVTEALTVIAHGEGFDRVAFAAVGQLESARKAAEEALDEGRLAEMRWMDADWIARATDVQTFLAGARTVMVVALACAPAVTGEPMDDGVARGKIANYAAGRDYHRVFESKLRRVARRIRQELGGEARATVDYGPLLERPWAVRAGLGWLGKSTMALVPGLGPWALFGVVATDLETAPSLPLRKTCGACTRCIVSCPTGAIARGGGAVDARLCISYHTIENRGSIPRELRPLFKDWVFGCDDCLTSCPPGWKAREAHPDFAPKDIEAARPSLAGLIEMDEAAFAERFRGRAIMRAKRDGMARNACVALGNVGSTHDLPALVQALGDGSAVVRGHAAWAIAEIARRTVGVAESVIEGLRVAAREEQNADAFEEMMAALDELGAMQGLEVGDGIERG